ncbi:MAG: ATP-binding cassette domain-containing protein [Magnetococcus sp. YQC-3]
MLQDLSWRGFAPPGEGVTFASLTWAIAEGERWAVVGPEGCGKSTLLRLMAGLIRPDGGEIRLAGQPLAQVSERAAIMGVLFADPATRFLTPVVREEVALTPTLFGVTGEALQQRVAEALREAGLPAGMAGRELATLSMAEAARVALAAVLVMQPRLLLWDEPGRDLSEAGEEALARQLGEKSLASVIFTSRMARAERFAGRIVQWEAKGWRIL